MDRIIGNRGGVPYVIAKQASAGSTTTNAVYTLPNHVFRFLGPAGLMVISIDTASEATVTGITLSSNDNQLTLTNNVGAEITTLPAGDHLVSFNKVANTIKLFV